MKRFLVNRWAFLILGLILGAAGGAGVAAVVSQEEIPLEELSTYTPVNGETEEQLRSELSEARADLNEAQQEVADLQVRIDRLEEERAEEEERNTFSDGIWEVGTEVRPGVYRSSAGSNCYWAILGSADTSDIENNGGFGPNQTITLTAGKWIESSDCGTWERIGGGS